MFEQHSHAITQVLNHFVLQSFWLHPERVPKCACTSPQQIVPATPVEPIPLAQQFFAMAQLGFPLSPPMGPQAARHDHSHKRNQAEMWSAEESFTAREQRHGFDLRRVTVSGRALFSAASVPTAGSA